MNGIHGYAEFQAASGLAAGSIAFGDAATAAAEITQNWAKPEYLTWDSFVRRFTGAPYNYPIGVIQSVLQAAWPFLPTKIREGLSRRARSTAPPPALPATTAPHVKPPGEKPGLSKAVVIGGAVLGVGLIAAIAYAVGRK